MKKPCEEIEVGDVIVFDRTPHLIREIHPYSHPSLRETAGIALAADGWAFTLYCGSRVEVA